MDYIKELKAILPRSIHPYLGNVRRRLRAFSARTRRQKQDLLNDPALDEKQLELLRKVESKISPGDGMYAGNGAHYFKVGLSAIRCIESAMDAVGIASLQRVLDLPCGHGRVLRFLIHRFPEAKFTAADVDRTGVDFCVRSFGVKGVYLEPDSSHASIGQQFDLIWCGSLITHLDQADIHGLLEFFARHLIPGGLLILTTHGERAIEKMLNQELDYLIPAELIGSLIENYQKAGFGFVNYPGANGYGVSLSSPSWIRGLTEKLGFHEVYFRERGWDDHQDVYGLLKSSASKSINP